MNDLIEKLDKFREFCLNFIGGGSFNSYPPRCKKNLWQAVSNSYDLKNLMSLEPWFPQWWLSNAIEFLPGWRIFPPGSDASLIGTPLGLEWRKCTSKSEAEPIEFLPAVTHISSRKWRKLDWYWLAQMHSMRVTQNQTSLSWSDAIDFRCRGC